MCSHCQRSLKCDSRYCCEKSSRWYLKVKKQSYIPPPHPNSFSVSLFSFFLSLSLFLSLHVVPPSLFSVLWPYSLTMSVWVWVHVCTFFCFLFSFSTCFSVGISLFHMVNVQWPLFYCCYCHWYFYHCCILAVVSLQTGRWERARKSIHLSSRVLSS